MGLAILSMSVVSLLASDQESNLFSVLLGIVLVANAGYLSQLRVVVDDEGFVVPAGLRSRRTPWTRIERIRLDWASETTWRTPRQIQIERRDGEILRATAPTRMGSRRWAQREQLTAALRRRAERHGFELEVAGPARARVVGHPKSEAE